VTPLIVAVAPTGARRDKHDHPNLPMTPGEIAAAARASLAVGAAMIHLHVRDSAGRHTLDVDAYRTAIAAIRAEVGERMVIQMTTEAAGRYAPAEQMAAVRALKPEAVSLAIREIVADAAAEGEAAAFLAWCHRERVATHYILYDGGDRDRLVDLHRRGIVPQSHPFRLYVLGRYAGGVGARPADLIPFVAGDDRGAWMVCAFGGREAAAAALAVALGGHVRVGFENNLHRPDGSLAEGNADLVAPVAAIAAALARPLADADQLRQAMAEWG